MDALSVVGTAIIQWLKAIGIMGGLALLVLLVAWVRLWWLERFGW